MDPTYSALADFPEGGIAGKNIEYQCNQWNFQRDSENF